VVTLTPEIATCGSSRPRRKHSHYLARCLFPVELQPPLLLPPTSTTAPASFAFAVAAALFLIPPIKLRISVHTPLSLSGSSPSHCANCTSIWSAKDDSQKLQKSRHTVQPTARLCLHLSQTDNNRHQPTLTDINCETLPLFPFGLDLLTAPEHVPQ
jgi:hypothetical protein